MGGEALHAQMHHEGTLCCDRAWSLQWSSWDRQQMSLFVMHSPYNWTVIYSPRRAGPGNSVSIFIRIRTTTISTVFSQSLYLALTFCDRTRVDKQHQQIARPPAATASAYFHRKTLRSDSLNFKGWVTGCRRKVSGMLADNAEPRSWVIYFTTRELRKIILEEVVKFSTPLYLIINQSRMDRCFASDLIIYTGSEIRVTSVTEPSAYFLQSVLIKT